MNEPITELSRAERMELWREAMAQLRYLNDEVWKRLQFFLWLQLALLVLGGGSLSRQAAIPACAFLLISLFCGFTARYVLRRNRVYYLQMLARKALLEDSLGLHAAKFSATEIDHAFPWRLGPEVVEKIKADHNAWVEGSVRPKGTIVRPLFWLVEMLILLNGLAFVAAVLMLFRR